MKIPSTIELIVYASIAVIVIVVGIGVGIQIYNMDLKAGHIVFKRYVPAYVDFQSVATSKNTYVNVPIQHPDEYYITFEGETEKGVWKRRTIRVDQHTYHSVTNGQWFTSN